MIAKSNAPETVKVLNDFDQDFGDLAAWYAVEVKESSGLTLKQRAFMSIACDVCDQMLSGPLEFHIRMALENGATRQDVKEAILHMGVYGAYPKCFETIARLKEIYAQFDEKGLYLTGDKVSHPKPELNWVLDTDVKEGLIAFDPQYGDLSSPINSSQLLAVGVRRDIQIGSPHAHRALSIFIPTQNDGE